MTAEPRLADAVSRRYFEEIAEQREGDAAKDPVCLYLEVTNRCNLPCTTCPRTYEELEPEKDMSFDMFTRIVDQSPSVKRVVLHGVGEPMMVKDLPRMVSYLKARGIYVLFNTNGTLLKVKKSRELIEAGLDELRVSLDAAEAGAYAKIRGRDMFDAIVRNLKGFLALKREIGVEHPRVSLWLTGLKETIEQLPAFVRVADEIGVKEVHLQRLVYFPEGQGMAQPSSSLFESIDVAERAYLEEAKAVARELGVFFDASGAAEPEESLSRHVEGKPWSMCRRPWSLMYFTAHGRALPCCIAPFSMHGYDSFTLGDATTQTLPEIWNGDAYHQFREELLSDKPPGACANCGLRWSL
ncbi:Radical SAM superfamily enzyme, MoaA/NifB/PqqE/SkfB family [Rhizobiales bacterium GAS188]|nr:Radical SAM superfamily enzyme, MoaA/NifB/PqqE/SkfB family [Rhizobiales bacterium GAS188]